MAVTIKTRQFLLEQIASMNPQEQERALQSLRQRAAICNIADRKYNEELYQFVVGQLKERMLRIT